MKTPCWEKGNKGATTQHPLKNGKKLLRSNSPVTKGMHVSAQYKGESVSLRIAEEIEPRIFKAIVMGSYFLDGPDVLNNGDEVSIGRDFILWLNGKD